MLSSLKGKANIVTRKNLNIYIAPWRPKIQRHLEDIELNQARSKPDPVEQNVRTACTTVHHYNDKQYFSIDKVMLMFPFFQTNTTS